MSVAWIFAIVYAIAWGLGLRVLRRLRRRSNLLITLFAGAVVGLVNYALLGLVHGKFLATWPLLSILLVFGLRIIGHSLALIGYYDRSRGRGPRRGGRWRILLAGGLYFAAVGLGLEALVHTTGYWEASDLVFEIDQVSFLWK